MRVKDRKESTKGKSDDVAWRSWNLGAAKGIPQFLGKSCFHCPLNYTLHSKQRSFTKWNLWKGHSFRFRLMEKASAEKRVSEIGEESNGGKIRVFVTFKRTGVLKWDIFKELWHVISGWKVEREHVAMAPSENTTYLWLGRSFHSYAEVSITSRSEMVIRPCG